jgi:hypothetical protein
MPTKIRQRKREKKLQDNSSPEVTSQRESDSETLVASLDSAIPLNEKNGKGCSPLLNQRFCKIRRILGFQKILVKVHYLNHVMLLKAMRRWIYIIDLKLLKFLC